MTLDIPAAATSPLRAVDEADQLSSHMNILNVNDMVSAAATARTNSLEN